MCQNTFMNATTETKKSMPINQTNYSSLLSLNEKIFIDTLNKFVLWSCMYLQTLEHKPTPTSLKHVYTYTHTNKIKNTSMSRNKYIPSQIKFIQCPWKCTCVCINKCTRTHTHVHTNICDCAHTYTRVTKTLTNIIQTSIGLHTLLLSLSLYIYIYIIENSYIYCYIIDKRDLFLIDKLSPEPLNWILNGKI